MKKEMPKKGSLFPKGYTRKLYMKLKDRTTSIIQDSHLSGWAAPTHAQHDTTTTIFYVIILLNWP